MKEIIEKLESSVLFAEKEGDDMDAVSWTFQNGILISPNEAKLILAGLKQKPSELHLPTVEQITKVMFEVGTTKQTEKGISMDRVFEDEANAIIDLIKNGEKV